jgi:NADPH-dependent 2,4-dienoyl-CoA reductase/sulfur reductase-like enzyme/peroxiredoxin family protein/rhodanese-related sulfurtransferase/TusA-related sulfurtransferase
MNKRKIVIIGGVAGGATAAAKLRRLSEKDEIIIFEKDEYISFANCGLPYYIGNVITDRSKLLVQTVEGMSKRFNLDIRNLSEVTSIDRVNKEVHVRKSSGVEYQESYDILILSPGASPIVPPIPGLKESSNVFILRNIPHMDAIANFIKTKQPKKATVIGGGFIGVEMAENLIERGLEVTLVDMADQVLAPVDYEMSQLVHEELTRHGVRLVLKDGVKSFHQQGRVVETQSGLMIDSDLIILAIGVTSETRLAKDAGLEIGDLKGILVDEHLRTSDPSIYALGDAIEVKSRVNGLQTKIPLAWPANRQGVVVANVIHGVEDFYPGSFGTAVAKVFDLTVASTGLNERLCKAQNIPYKVVHVNRNNHASYYPGATSMILKLVFSSVDGTIYGAQAIGQEGTEKRIDVIATAMAGGLKVKDLANLELSYAPPYSSAKDPVNILGYVATHVFNMTYNTLQWNEVDERVKQGHVLLDVRTSLEYDLGHIPGSINIDLDELRQNLNHLPHVDTPIIVTCQVGHRGYLAIRILQENGFTQLFNLDGGYRLYEVGHHDFNNPSGITGVAEAKYVDEQVIVALPDTDLEVIHVDACGLQCPGPILETYKAIEKMAPNQVLRVESSDFGFYSDISKWAEKTGNTMLDVKIEGKKVIATLKKGQDKPRSQSTSNENATIVLFSGELDKALAAMVIANGAASMGKKVSVFATFWGLNFLRKEAHVNVEKTLVEKMFGMMMPKGANQLPLSKMQMGGLGKAMMLNVMKQKNVETLPNLMAQAMELGVDFIACTMSMDVMGIKKEELIDGISYGGVATYLAESEDAGLTLFI